MPPLPHRIPQPRRHAPCSAGACWRCAYDFWPALALWMLVSLCFTLGYTIAGHDPHQNIAPWSALQWLIWCVCWLVTGAYAVHQLAARRADARDAAVAAARGRCRRHCTVMACAVPALRGRHDFAAGSRTGILVGVARSRPPGLARPGQRDADGAKGEGWRLSASVASLSCPCSFLEWKNKTACSLRSLPHPPSAPSPASGRRDCRRGTGRAARAHPDLRRNSQAETPSITSGGIR